MTPHAPHDDGGYERTDAHAGATYRAGLYILLTMFLTALVVVPMYRFLGRREASGQEPPATVVRPDAVAPGPAVPRLLVSEPSVLAAFRAQEEELLAGWGWVEKDEGIARMPIEEAMKIVAERGLPAFPAPAVPAPAEGGAR
jgi:hypothetical protein